MESFHCITQENLDLLKHLGRWYDTLVEGVSGLGEYV